MYTIGVDIGGMSIKVGLVDLNGKIISKNTKKTEKTADLCIDNIVVQINDLLKENNLTVKDVLGIGIGCPGAVSSSDGKVIYLPNLGWENVDLSELLEKKTGINNIKINNDANVAALAEAKFGAAKGHDICLMFTLGTGVGGGIILGGKIFEGGHSRGAELGHSILVLDGKQCTCGRKGCIETYVSATALIEQTREEMLKNKSSKMWDFVDGDVDKVDGRTSFECAKKGDKSANIVVDNYVKYLSESILDMLNIFRPDAFILGGGVSAQKEYLTDKVKAYLEKFDYGYKNAPRTEILTATLGNDAGIIGAAALVM